MRISLRGLLVGVLLINLALGLFVWRARARLDAVAAWETVGVDVVFDDDKAELANSNFTFTPRQPHPLKGYLGESAVQEAVIVSFVNANQGASDDDLKTLQVFGEVKCLCLSRIEAFGVPRCHVTDAGINDLSSLRRVEVLQTSGARLSDRAAEQLSKLRSLRTLWLNDTQLTDQGLDHLARLPNLLELCVSRTQVTKGGVASFRKRSPHCKIYWEGD